MIDSIDLQILTILQDCARTSNADIARRVGLTPSAVLERIRKLENRGHLLGYHAHLNPPSVGRGMLAFIFVRTNERIGDTSAAVELAKIPQVQEVHHVAGEDCYLAKVRVDDPATLGMLLRETFGRIPSVVSTRSTVVLETLKEDPRLPLDPPTGDDHVS
ncbi:MAG: Lrp/AsnC family transcriptional regulator [Holophagales bacterium]|nr:Lrp/AsnC family transcriptional regulator [Holophagales bacterium]